MGIVSCFTLLEDSHENLLKSAASGLKFKLELQLERRHRCNVGGKLNRCYFFYFDGLLCVKMIKLPFYCETSGTLTSKSFREFLSETSPAVEEDDKDLEGKNEEELIYRELQEKIGKTLLAGMLILKETETKTQR